jgi:hypothetical protein
LHGARLSATASSAERAGRNQTPSLGSDILGARGETPTEARAEPHLIASKTKATAIRVRAHLGLACDVQHGKLSARGACVVPARPGPSVHGGPRSTRARANRTDLQDHLSADGRPGSGRPVRSHVGRHATKYSAQVRQIPCPSPVPGSNTHSAIFALYASPMQTEDVRLEKNDTTPSPLRLPADTFLERARFFLQGGFGSGDTPSPFLLHWGFHAFRYYYANHELDGRLENRQALRDLEAALFAFGKRWKLAGRILPGIVPSQQWLTQLFKAYTCHF